MIRVLALMACIVGTGCLWSDEGGDVTAPGCGDRMIDQLHESCDDGNTESGDGCSSTCRTETTATVHWKIENSAGAPQPCPAGFDTVEVTPLALRFTGTTIPFRCEDGQGTLQWLEEPRSPVSALQLRITSSISHEVFGETIVSPIQSEGVPLDITGTLVTDLGRLHLHWTLSKAGAPSSCAALGVASIRIDLIPAVGPTVTLTGECSNDYPTGFLPTGTYRVELTASSAGGPGFGARDGVAVPTGRLLTDLAPIDIAF